MKGYELEIELPLAKTSANRTRGMNQFSLYKIQKSIKNQVKLLSLNNLPKSPLTSFQISVIRHSSRFMDYDNLISSLKPAIDGLTLAGIIQDDSWQYIKSINIDQVISKEKKLVIRVEEV